jgi:type III restriction enzyme
MAKDAGSSPTTPPAYTNVYTVKDRHELRLEFPRLVQVVPDIHDTLDVDVDSIEPIRVTGAFDPTDTYVEFDLGAPHAGMGGETQNRERAYEHFRIQRLLYKVAAGLIQPYNKPWLFPQALDIASRLIRPISDGGKIDYAPGVDEREICNFRYLILIRERLAAALRPGEGLGRFLASLDEYQPSGSTDAVNYSAPTDKCVLTVKSHISHAVCDSGLERRMCAVLDSHPEVDAWVKNHKLHLEIPFLYLGVTHRYRPDFIVRLRDGRLVLLEGKGEADEKDDAKATSARRWVEAINTLGSHGQWVYSICYNASTLAEQLDELASTAVLIEN